MNTSSPIKSERVLRFVEEYAKDRNGTQAAIRAGYSPKTAGAQASTMLKDPKIQTLITGAKEKVAEAAKFEAVDVLRHWVDIATADPTKIARIRHVNCRHCWGAGHAYQWRTREYAEECDKVARMGDKPIPLCDGGFGFVGNRPPHPDCPECHGEGIEQTFFEDMGRLGPAERRLIASVKRTKDGLEVKMRDQDGALKHIAQYIGMLTDKVQLTGKDGGPVVTANIPLDLPGDPAQVAALYGKLLG